MRWWWCVVCVVVMGVPTFAQTDAQVFGVSGGAAITADNSAELVQLARFGGGAAQALEWSPDGELLAVAGSVGVWVYASAELSDDPLLLVGHTAPVYSVTFSPDGAFLASGGGDATVRIWDVASGELMQTLEVPYSAVFTEVAWDGTANQIIAATDLGEILLWDAEADETSGTLPAQGNITELAFAPQTPVLGVATTEGGIAYWNIVNQENIQTMPADSGIVHFAWSPDGTQLARITVEGAIELLDAVSNERLQQMSAANRPVVLDYAPSGTVIAVGDMTGTINLLDAASLDTLTTWNVAAAVVELAYQPNGNLLAVLSAEGLYLWDGTEIVASLGGIFRNGAAVQAVFAPEAAHIAVSYASTSANLVQYDLESGAVLTSGEVFGQAIPPYVRLHYSPDGTLIAVNDTFGIALLNSETGEQNTYLDTVGTVISFAFTPDGSLIVTGDNGGVLQVWDTASGQVLATFQDHTAAIQHVAFNAAGALLLSASADGTVRVYGIGQ